MTRKTVMQWMGVGLAVVFGGLAVVSAHHAWGTYHWERSSNPITLSVGGNFKNAYPSSATWGKHLDAAVVDWNARASGYVMLNSGEGWTSSRRCKASNGGIEVCADSYGSNGWLGLAQIWLDGTTFPKPSRR